MTRDETFDDFRCLSLAEVWARAQEAAERPESEQSSTPREEAQWRWLYREMRSSRASTVADLDTKVVENYASRLGYGYLRSRSGRRGTFMPFERR